MSTKILTSPKRNEKVFGWESAAAEAERLSATSDDDARKRRLRLTAAWFRQMEEIGERFPGSSETSKEIDPRPDL